MAEARATFILRLWREPSTPAGEWYSQIECLPTGPVRHFANLLASFNYIQAQLAGLEQGEKRYESPTIVDNDF
jgi:hypothetical protein